MVDKFEKRFDHLLNLAEKNTAIIETQSKSVHELIIRLSPYQRFGTSEKTLFTSKDVQLSHKENWICPVLPCFVNPCRACKYYGHTQDSCRNILPTYKSSCSRCWQSGHSKDRCLNDKKDTPFRSQYISPEELVEKNFGYRIDNGIIDEQNPCVGGRTYGLPSFDDENEEGYNIVNK